MAKKSIRYLRGTLITASVLLVIVGLTSWSISPRELGWRVIDRVIEHRYPDISQIETNELADLLSDADDRVLLLDIRTEEEFKVSHLRGAVHFDRAPNTVSSIRRDSSIVVLYCSVGLRSARFAKELAKAEFPGPVLNLRGSIFKWANESRPVYRDGSPVREVHPYNWLWGRMLESELRTYAP